MHQAQYSSLVPSLIAAVTLLAGSACQPAEQEIEETEIATPVESRFAYGIAIEDGRAEEGFRRVGKDFRFRSGDSFRLALHPDFEAYAYLFHRAEGDRSYAALFPHSRVGVGNPLPANRQTFVPDGQRKWTLDKDKGIEHLVLVVSSAPWELKEGSGGSVHIDVLERGLAELEMSRRPGSYSVVEEGGWTKVFFDAEMRDAALVARIPMSHE